MDVGLSSQNVVFMKRRIAVTTVLALILAACASSRAEIVAEFPGADTTTSTTSSLLPPQTTTTTTVENLQAQISGLAEAVEGLREVSFNELPAIVRRPDELVQSEYRRVHTFSGAHDAAHTDDFLRMLGVLEGGESIAELEVTAPVPGVDDSVSGEILISADVDELTPFGRLTLVGELIAAVTDQQFGWSARVSELQEAGNGEGADALRALVTGDAAHFSQLYLEEFMTATEQFAVQLETLEQERAVLPDYVNEFKEFGNEEAAAFVEDLISEGGIAKLNAAYAQPPVSSEHVYHTFRYLNAEAVRSVELPGRSISGFDEVEAGSFGERGLRALLAEGVSDARKLEAATGWGGDSYRLWWDGESTVLLLMFEGDAGRDATSLAETLGRWAIEELSVGGGLTDNTGLAFEGIGSYAFVAESGTEVLLVVSSDPVTGKRLRDSFWPEY